MRYGLSPRATQALRDARQRAGLTQRELAEKVDVSLSSICAYEVGGRRPGIPVVRRLADVLDIDADVLAVLDAQ